MTARLAALLSVAVLLACRARPVPAAAPSPEPLGLPTGAAPVAQASPVPPQVERDLLRYGDSPATDLPEADAGEPVVFDLASPSEAPPPTPPPPARLVGFVRRGERLCAALVLASGEPEVLCPGDELGGHRLLAADEERGVRLTLPDGRALDLPAPR